MYVCAPGLCVCVVQCASVYVCVPGLCVCVSVCVCVRVCAWSVGACEGAAVPGHSVLFPTALRGSEGEGKRGGNEQTAKKKKNTYSLSRQIATVSVATDLRAILPMSGFTQRGAHRRDEEETEDEEDEGEKGPGERTGEEGAPAR